MREQTKLQKLCCAAVIGALYAAVTLLLAPISYGNLQCRVSEALCILPWFFPETAWGLFAGCLLANLLGGQRAAGHRIRLPRHPDRLPHHRPPEAPGPCAAASRDRERRDGGRDAGLCHHAGFLLVQLSRLCLEVGVGEAVAMYVLGLPLSFVLERIPYVRKYGVKHGKNP